MLPARSLDSTATAERLPEEAPDHAALLERVAADARREPERYLEDSVVPEGGE
jgi:hypothetical protein